MNVVVLVMFLISFHNPFHKRHHNVPPVVSIPVSPVELDEDCIYDPEFRLWFYIDTDDAIGASQISCSAAYGEARRTNSPVRYPGTEIHLKHHNI